MTQQRNIFIEIVKDSLALFWRSCAGLLVMAVIFYVPWILVDRYFWQNSDIVSRIIHGHSLGLYQILEFIYSIILLLWMFFYMAVSFLYIDGVKNNNRPKITAVYKKAASVFGEYLKVKILYIAKTLGWSVLLIVPGIYYGLLYSLAGIVNLCEGQSGNKALERSVELVKPFFKAYAGSVLFGGFFMAVCYFLPLYGLTTALIVMIRDRLGHFTLAQTLVYVQILIVSLGVIALMVYLYQIYDQLKRLSSADSS